MNSASLAKNFNNILHTQAVVYQVIYITPSLAQYILFSELVKTDYP